MMIEDLQTLARNQSLFFREVRGQGLSAEHRDIVAKLVILIQKRAQIYEDRRDTILFSFNFGRFCLAQQGGNDSLLIWLPYPHPQDSSELAQLVLPDPDFELASNTTQDDGWGCLAIDNFDAFLEGRILQINNIVWL
jgi:hypothetical protein